ncbi:hypothetical protein [Mycobacterium palustre]|uniref:hypothetical protein n=1 Tax=Mycobacterium palustre TaxID=153971 RepID=UPI000A14652F|nr:hypothetical protein [Mycobacterium palustre]MCV7101199.1 hypothetical protein [Mycobacterium palustre]
MCLSDKFVSIDERYSFGIESKPGRCYVSIPVRDGIVEYEECYEITEDENTKLLHDEAAAVAFVEACRRREHDDLLVQRPGSEGGTPV